MAECPVTLQGIIKSMGLVFGDIGTSPIYTLTAIFLLIPATRDNIPGIISLIIWRIFAAIKRLCPSVVQFYKLPPDKIHGVITRIEM